MCNSDLKQNTAIVVLNEYVALLNENKDLMCDNNQLRHTIKEINNDKVVFIKGTWANYTVINPNEATKLLIEEIEAEKRNSVFYEKKFKDLKQMSIWEFVKYKFKKQDE